MTPGVYLFRLGDFYKIGHSRNPPRRLMHLAELPYPTELVHVIRSASARAVEQALHNHFKPQRVCGEWFRLSEADVALIRSVERADRAADLPPSLRTAPAHNAATQPRPQRDPKLAVVGLLINVTREQHARIKEAAKRCGCSMCDFCLRAALKAADQVLESFRTDPEKRPNIT